MSAAEAKLARDVRRLFENDNTDPLDEELELDANCRSRWYRWSRLELDTYLKLCSLKLAKEVLVDQGRPSCLVLNRLEIEESSSEPPRILGRSRLVVGFWRSRLTRPLLHLILAYLIVKFALVTFFIYKRDSSIKYWQPRLRSGATRNGPCTLSYEPHLESVHHVEMIKQSNAWLDFFGDVYKCMIGAPIMLLQFMSCFVNSLYIFSFFSVPDQKPRLDHLNFTINPHGERDRIRRELDKIMAKLMDGLAHQAAISRLSHQHQLQKHKQQTHFDGNIRRHVEATKYLNLLVSISHLVRPANLTAKWHRRLLKLGCGYTPLMMLSQFAGLGAGGLALCLECIIRAMNRLANMKCQAWHPSGELIKPRLELNELPLASDLEAYAKHDGTFMNVVRLGLNIESKYLIPNKASALFVAELIYLMIFTCIVFPTFECLYWWCVVDKLKWVWQVEAQLRCCVAMSNRLEGRQRGGNLAAKSADDRELDDEHLVKYLSISYLNYRLLMGQLAAFMPTARVFITPMVVAGCFIMLISYIVATQTESLFSRWVLVGVLFFVVQTNFYLATGAFFLSKSQRMMKSISQLISLSHKGSSSNRRIITDLWRRQLLSPEQLTRLSGINILGNPVSFNLLKTLNFYLILLCLFLFRSSNQF